MTKNLILGSNFLEPEDYRCANQYTGKEEEDILDRRPKKQ
jgi:hypothetical protein